MQENNKSTPKKNLPKIYRQDEISTLSDPNAKTRDNDGDGVPDYLQRSELRSIARSCSDTNLYEIDALKLKEDLIMKWRGYMYSSERSVYVPVSPPMINEEGIMKLSQILDSYVNAISMTTWYQLEYVHAEALYASRKVNAWLTDNRRNWGVRVSDLSPISAEIDQLVTAAMSKSINDKQREHTTGRTRVTENRSTEPPRSI